jgi:hypothetical protein
VEQNKTKKNKSKAQKKKKQKQNKKRSVSECPKKTGEIVFFFSSDRFFVLFLLVLPNLWPFKGAQRRFEGLHPEKNSERALRPQWGETPFGDSLPWVKKPEIPSTPPKPKRVILELTLLQSQVLHIPHKKKAPRQQQGSSSFSWSATLPGPFKGFFFFSFCKKAI